MRQIRGFEPGARIERVTVRRKWHDPPTTWWLTWTDRDVGTPGNHRLNLPETVWNRYEIGDEIEIIYVPGDDSPYHRDGLFADDGNFAFDYGILAVEIALIGIAVLGAPIMLWRMRA